MTLRLSKEKIVRGGYLCAAWNRRWRKLIVASSNSV